MISAEIIVDSNSTDCLDYCVDARASQERQEVRSRFGDSHAAIAGRTTPLPLLDRRCQEMVSGKLQQHSPRSSAWPWTITSEKDASDSRPLGQSTEKSD